MLLNLDFGKASKPERKTSGRVSVEAYKRGYLTRIGVSYSGA